MDRPSRSGPQARENNPLWYAAVGALSGARTMAGPALVAERFRETQIPFDAMPARLLQTGNITEILDVLAVVEMVMDKMPFVGDRTSVIGLVPRAVSGGFSGAALSSSQRQGWAVGAILGTLGAVVGTFAAFEVRRVLHRGLGLPNLVAGIAEDGLLFGLRRLLSARL